MRTDHLEERRRFISEAFHSLNQPLTGLHCGLEIAVQKPRSEDEYRQRIGEGIENAGTVLRLVRALRQLVEATDRGERFGTVGLSMLLSQLKSELEVVAETAAVGLEVECECDAQVQGDPGKLMAALGGLAAMEMEGCDPGARVKIIAKPAKRQVVLSITADGTRKSPPDGPAAKLEEIRRHAAFSYLWTVGGDFEVLPAGIKIKLAATK